MPPNGTRQRLEADCLEWHGLCLRRLMGERLAARRCICGGHFVPTTIHVSIERTYCSAACFFASLKVPLSTVYRRDGGRCHLCGDRVRRAEASRDHIVPRSRGGPTTWTNIALAHRTCTSLRGDAPLDAGR